MLDDHPCTRLGLVHLLEGTGMYRAVVQGAHGGELVAALEGGTEVGLVLLDLQMPVMDGLATLEWLATERAGLPAVALCERGDDLVLVRAYRAQARAVLCKGAPCEQVVAAVQAALQGAVLHTPHSHQLLLDNPLGEDPEDLRRARLVAQIPPRCMDVLRVVVRSDALTYQAAGLELNMGKRTVEDHINKLFGIFGVHSRSALVVSALELQVVRRSGLG